MYTRLSSTVEPVIGPTHPVSAAKARPGLVFADPFAVCAVGHFRPRRISGAEFYGATNINGASRRHSA